MFIEILCYSSKMFSSLLDVARNSPFRGPLSPAQCEPAIAAPQAAQVTLTNIWKN